MKVNRSEMVALIIFGVMLLLLAFFATGCGDVRIGGGKAAKMPTSQMISSLSSRAAGAEHREAMTLSELKDARADAVRDRGDLDVRVADFDAQIKIAQDEKDSHISRLIGWGFFVTALLCVVAAFASPLMKTTLAKLAGGFGAASIGSFLFADYRVYIEWSALAIILIGAGIFLIRLVPRLHLLNAILPHIDDIAGKIPTKANAIASQLKSKLKG